VQVVFKSTLTLTYSLCRLEEMVCLELSILGQAHTPTSDTFHRQPICEWRYSLSSLCAKNWPRHWFFVRDQSSFRYLFWVSPCVKFWQIMMLLTVWRLARLEAVDIFRKQATALIIHETQDNGFQWMNFENPCFESLGWLSLPALPVNPRGWPHYRPLFHFRILKYS